MPVPFNIVGIDHVVLRAADPTKLERFYLDALGLTFEKRQGELVQLRAGNALIDIVPADEAGPAGGTSSPGGANLDHLCLRIEPFDQAAITKHLAKHHVACGAETLRYGAEGEGPSIYLRDPEGIANRVKRRSGHHLLCGAAPRGRNPFDWRGDRTLKVALRQVQDGGRGQFASRIGTRLCNSGIRLFRALG